ncbi:NAD(P)-binding protein [Phlegmacium glaucopus]|nr:NAD(P)-binding protein [Phlegmacium glaucopus]
MSLLVLSSSDVDTITSNFSPQDLQLLMAQVFALISTEGTIDARKCVSMPPRIVIPTLNHTALFMPAHIGTRPAKISTEAPSDLGISNQSPEGQLPTFALEGTAIKVVCVPAKSDPRGLPGTTLVLDQVTGGVKAVVNARNLTALRNAAGSLLSTSLIGPSMPRKLVAFGAGKQIDAHLDLFIRHFPSISHCTIVNRTVNVRSNSLKESIKARFHHINLHVISSQEELSENNVENQDHRNSSQIEDAVRSADIIICATSSTVPLLPSSWVRTGTHVILIGSFTPAMREIERELVFRAVSSPNVESPSYMPCLLVDFRKACLEEAGELIEAELEPYQMTEIGELVPKDKDGNVQLEAYRELLSTNDRPRKDESGFDGPITIFKSVGIGLQDVAIACAVVEKALTEGSGTRIERYDG